MAYKMPHHRTLSKSNLCELAICSCKTALILKAENGRKKKKKVNTFEVPSFLM